MSKKAHISKSNQANLDLLLKLRKDLTTKGYDFKEFQGGDYYKFIEGAFDHEPILFVISHPECFADGLDKINLGRGIHSEALEAEIKGCKIIGVTENGYHEVSSVETYSDEELAKPNAWQLRYGFLKLKEPVNLEEDNHHTSDA